jgi:hypothetical protein
MLGNPKFLHRNFQSLNKGAYTCSASIKGANYISVDPVSLSLLEVLFDKRPLIFVEQGSQVVLTCGADSPSKLNYLPTITWTDSSFISFLLVYSPGKNRINYYINIFFVSDKNRIIHYNLKQISDHL